VAVVAFSHTDRGVGSPVSGPTCPLGVWWGGWRGGEIGKKLGSESFADDAFPGGAGGNF